MDNPSSVKAMFYEMENGELRGLFTFRNEHQSYPGRVHGGMITAMLDELIGRVLWIKEPESLAVTTTITVKYQWKKLLRKVTFSLQQPATAT